jgi:titin
VRDIASGVLVVDTNTSSTSYTVALTAGRQYRWNVAAGNSTGLSSYTTPLYFQTPATASIPASPTNLVASSGASSIELSWSDNSNNETGFKLERKVGSGGSWALYATLGANATTFSNTAVTAGTTYYYRVYAYNGTGPSTYYTNEASSALVAIVPNSPTSLTAIGSASAISLSWSDNSNNETGFKLERKVGSGGSWGLYATLGSNTSSYSDTSVSLGTTYYYRVFAYNGTGPSLYYTNEASASPTGTVPASPTNLTAVASATSVAVSWSDNSNNETGFKLERKTGSGGTWALYSTLGANATSFSNTSVTVGTTYYYRVYAYNATGPSAYFSNEASATPTGTVPSMPGSPSPGTTASPGPILSSSSVTMTWAASSGATLYSIGVRDIASGALVVDTTTTSTSYTATLTAGKQYRWNVAAGNLAGSSTYTTPRYFQTPVAAVIPTSPSNLVATGSASSIGLSWTDNSNNETGFKLERKEGSGGSWVLYATLAANATAFNNTVVTAGTTYYYRVYAYNATGPSTYFTNEAAASATGSVPAAPSNLTAAGSASSVTLAWRDNSTNESGFKVERKVGSGGVWAVYATLGSNVLNFTDTSVSLGTTYYYRVNSYNTMERYLIIIKI